MKEKGLLKAIETTTHAMEHSNLLCGNEMPGLGLNCLRIVVAVAVAVAVVGLSVESMAAGVDGACFMQRGHSSIAG